MRPVCLNPRRERRSELYDKWFFQIIFNAKFNNVQLVFNHTQVDKIVQDAGFHILERTEAKLYLN